MEQTLKFAIASRTPRTRFGTTSRKKYQENMLDMFATVFGLKHTYKTKVGNEYVRGVSGGERKRVSIAEAMAARGTMYCWDNATRGLDSSTALEYTRAIRASTNILKNVSVVAAYQAGENIYNLFDKITVLYSGKQIFFGPVGEAKAYFERLGYLCPPRQTTVEFLTAVTDPNGRYIRPGYEEIAPQTPEEFVSFWKNSPEYKTLLDERSRYNYFANPENTASRFRNVRSREKMKSQRKNSHFLLTYWSQLRLSVIRGFQRINGDRAYTITKLVGCIIQGIIIGTLFYNTSDTTSGAFSRGGLMYYTLLFNTLSAIADIPIAFENRPIILKQRGYSFYHPSVEALQQLVTDIPIRLILVATFSVILYFIAGLKDSFVGFIIFLLYSVLAAFCMSSCFQMISAMVRGVSPANSIAGITITALTIYAGFMIPTFSMHPWFRWINYINPLAYSFETVMANEFHNKNMPCDTIVPSGPGYEKVSSQNQVCAFSGSVPGKTTVDGDRYVYAEYRYKHDHQWRNLGIILGFWLLFIVLQTIFTEYLKPFLNNGDVLLFRRSSRKDPTNMPHTVQRKDSDATEMNEFSKDHLMDSFFSWQGVNYTIPVKGDKKKNEKKQVERKLLEDVYGYVVPGKLTALMGESGAGKTTLLNVLSQRVNMGTVTGDIHVNGRPIDGTFRRRTGYVQQQDVHLAECTVRESLQFAARLRQPSDVPDSEKLEYVEKIIRLLNMTEYAEAFVGTVGSGLSGEQRKKLSIGVELVAKPSLLLFLDEPTSGLDSQSAWGVIKLLRSLADSGQAILCTIHQPSATLFEQFDRLLLLSKGGKTAYFGDIGYNSQELVNYFEKYGARRCLDNENPAEYILDCIGAGATATTSRDWYRIWLNSEEFYYAQNDISKMSFETSQRPEKMIKNEMEKKRMEGEFAASYWTQVKWMLWRTSMQYWRSPTYIYSKLILMVIVGLFAGFTYWKVEDSAVGLKNVMFAILLILLLSAPLSNQIQAHVFPMRELFEVREKESNTFHWSVLPLTQFMVEIPYHVVFSTVLFFCFYFPGGYNTDASRAGIFYLVYCIFFQLYYISFALLIVYISPDVASASALTALFFTFKVAFCGVLQPKSQMPGFWTFMYKISPYTYFIQSFLSVILHDKPVHCDEDEFNVFEPMKGMTCHQFAGSFVRYAGGYLNNPKSQKNCQYCQYRVGDDFLKQMNADYNDKWRNIGFFVIYIVFNICAMLFLYYIFRMANWKQLGKKKQNQKANSKNHHNRNNKSGSDYNNTEPYYNLDNLGGKKSLKSSNTTMANTPSEVSRARSLKSTRRTSANSGKEWWLTDGKGGIELSNYPVDVSPFPPRAAE